MTGDSDETCGIAICRACGYPLKQLSGQRCPECGTEFDLEDASTFRTTPRLFPLGAFAIRWIVCAAVHFALLVSVFLAAVSLQAPTVGDETLVGFEVIWTILLLPVIPIDSLFEHLLGVPDDSLLPYPAASLVWGVIVAVCLEYRKVPRRLPGGQSRPHAFLAMVARTYRAHRTRFKRALPLLVPLLCLSIWLVYFVFLRVPPRPLFSYGFVGGCGIFSGWKGPLLCEVDDSTKVWFDTVENIVVVITCDGPKWGHDHLQTRSSILARFTDGFGHELRVTAADRDTLFILAPDSDPQRYSLRTGAADDIYSDIHRGMDPSLSHAALLDIVTGYATSSGD